MRKLIFAITFLISLAAYSQDEYYRIVDWKFYPTNVIQLTDSTYQTDAEPFDYNDPGAIDRIVGSYVVDFVGHRYSVIDSTSTTITVLDIYRTGQGPQTDQVARCYRSVYDGESKYIGSVDYFPLDESARWKLNGSDNELLWRHGIDYWLPFKRLVLDTMYVHDGSEVKGTMSWDNGTQSVETHISSDLHLNNGEELWVPLCLNNSGADILNGQPVYINSASGSDPTIRLASNVTYDESRLIGVATQNIPNGQKGRVTRFGYVNGIDLSSCTSGANVYLGDKVLTHIRPTGGTFPVVVGKAIVCTSNGRLLVYPQGVEYTAEVNKVDGWPSYLQGEQTNLSFSDLTRTLFVAPVGSTFYFYQAGVKYIKSGTQSFQISDVEGLHYIYYNMGEWGELVNPSPAQITEGIHNYASVSVVYWDATNKKAIYVGNERHTFHWPFWVRAFIHTSFWTQYLSGLGLTNITLGSGSLNADAQFGVDAGSIADEDIISSTGVIASTTGLPIYYRSGSGVWRMTTRAGYSFLNDGTTGLAQYNLFSGGIWSLVSMTNNYYRIVHVFANNNLTNNVFCVSGIAQYAAPADAENGIMMEINNIFSSALPFAEAKYIGALILHTKTGLGNSVNARYVAIPSTNTAYKDFRKAALQGYGGGGSGSLTFLGLSDTPDSYAGQANKIIGTTNLENGVEFKPVTVDGITGAINIPSGATYNKGGVPIISQTIDGSTTTLTASQKAIKDYADTKEPLLTKGNLTESIIGLQFDNTRQVIGGSADLSLTPGYIIPLTASITAYESHINNYSNPHNVTKTQVGLGNVTNDAQVTRTEMGTANGVATLDAGGKVPFTQLPSSLMIYKGTWSALTNTPTLADGIGTAGWVYKNNLAGTVNFGSGSISFYPGDWVIYNGSTWERSVGTDNVVSVNGQQGIVTLNLGSSTSGSTRTITISGGNSTSFNVDGGNAASVANSITFNNLGTGDASGTTYDGSVAKTISYNTLGAAPSSGSGNYIQNQFGSAQSANFNISGNGVLGGSLSVGSDLSINGNYTVFKKDNLNRFAFGIDGTETGVNSGSDLEIYRYADDGSYISRVFELNRSTGSVFFESTIQATTAKLTNLTDGYIPYQTSNGLDNSPCRIGVNGSSLYIGGSKNSTGGIIQLRDGIANGSNQSFAGIGISSSPGYDWTIGKYSNNTEGLFQIRDQAGNQRFTINESGNIGIGYSTGTEITNNKLAVNGSGYFNGAITSTSLTPNTLLKADANKVITSITNAAGYLYSDGSSNFSFANPFPNLSVQHLTGTTPTWNVSNGVNADISMSGATEITMSNLVAGTAGTLTVYCASSAYAIKIKGYTLSITKNAVFNVAGIQTSGSSKEDHISWYYDGTHLAIHVNYDYTVITY